MENIETHDFDVAWKIVLETFFEDFLELFLNKLYCNIDWDKGYVSLEQELQDIFKDNKIGKKRADKIVQVTLKNGEKRLILIHLEVQSSPKKEFNKRMFIYYYRLFNKYECPIVSNVIYTYSGSSYKTDCFQEENYGTELTFKYNMFDVESYEIPKNNINPFCKVIEIAKEYLQVEKQGNKDIDLLESKKKLYKYLIIIM
jgi:hypothetical protein